MNGAAACPAIHPVPTPFGFCSRKAYSPPIQSAGAATPHRCLRKTAPKSNDGGGTMGSGTISSPMARAGRPIRRQQALSELFYTDSVCYWAHSLRHRGRCRGGWQCLLGSPGIVPRKEPPTPIDEQPLGFCTSLSRSERISPHRFSYGRFARRV